MPGSLAESELTPTPGLMHAAVQLTPTTQCCARAAHKACVVSATDGLIRLLSQHPPAEREHNSNTH